MSLQMSDLGTFLGGGVRNLTILCINLKFLVCHSLGNIHRFTGRNHRTQQAAVLTAKACYGRRILVRERYLGGASRNPYTSSFMLSPSLEGTHSEHALFSSNEKCSHLCAICRPSEAHWWLGTQASFMGDGSYGYPLSSTFQKFQIPRRKASIQHKSEWFHSLKHSEPPSTGNIFISM